MRLVLSDAQTVHGKGGLLEELGEFPSTKYAEIPMAQDAKQYLESGPTGLERYLPYWLASRMEWFIFVILPILVLAYPLLSNIPSLYDNYIHTQIDRWYVEVRKVEKQLPVYNVAELDEKITWTDDLHEFLTRRVHVPMFYLSDYYQLRGALGVVIERLEKRRRVVLLRQEELANLALLNAGEEVVTEFGSAGAASVPPPQATPAALSPNNGNSGPPDSGPPDLP